MDRLLINDEWLEAYPNASAVADRPLLSDHVPILLNFNQNSFPRYKCFKYFNYWTDIQKVKQELIVWCTVNELNDRAKMSKRAKDSLMQIQEQLSSDPLNVELIKQEKEAIVKHFELLKRGGKCKT